MNLITKLKELITREKVKKKKEGKKSFLLPLPKKLNPEKVNPERKIRECGICKNDVLPDEVMTKNQGIYMHKSCIKYAKKYFSV